MHSERQSFEIFQFVNIFYTEVLKDDTVKISDKPK